MLGIARGLLEGLPAAIVAPRTAGGVVVGMPGVVMSILGHGRVRRRRVPLGGQHLAVNIQRGQHRMLNNGEIESDRNSSPNASRASEWI